MPRTSTDVGGTAASCTPSRACASLMGAGELSGDIVTTDENVGPRKKSRRTSRFRPRVLARKRADETVHSLADRDGGPQVLGGAARPRDRTFRLQRGLADA